MCFEWSWCVSIGLSPEKKNDHLSNIDYGGNCNCEGREYVGNLYFPFKFIVNPKVYNSIIYKEKTSKDK